MAPNNKHLLGNWSGFEGRLHRTLDVSKFGSNLKKRVKQQIKMRLMGKLRNMNPNKVESKFKVTPKEEQGSPEISTCQRQKPKGVLYFANALLPVSYSTYRSGRKLIISLKISFSSTHTGYHGKKKREMPM